MTRRINSRDKGARGERELAKYLRSLGFNVERSARNGVKGASDCIWRDYPETIIEVKNCDRYRPGRKELDGLIGRLRAEHGSSWLLFVHEPREPWRMYYFDTFYDHTAMTWDDGIAQIMDMWAAFPRP